MKITIVQAEDWAGLYKDGEIVFQGHDLQYSDIISAINAPDLQFDEVWVEGGWLAKVGHLPETLDEVHKAEGA